MNLRNLPFCEIRMKKGAPVIDSVEMKLSEIIQAVAPLRVEGNAAENQSIETLLTDSRQLGAQPEHTLFFALRTAKNDGVHYIPCV